MALHQVSGRWKLGLVLTLSTVGLWATLPVALKVSLEQTDAITVTWFRFLFAAALMAAWLLPRGALRKAGRLEHGHWWLLAIAAIGLIGNYVLYLIGLDYTTPGNAQVIIQLAPILMAMGGLLVFGERFSRGQWLGLLVLLTGLGLFFRDQLLVLGGNPRYLIGAGVMVAAAIVWAVYALAQKQLLGRLGSATIMLFIYAVACVLLLPWASPSQLLALDAKHWAILLYCALNTLVAYGAFAEALAHWEASRVSAVLALTPLLTFAAVATTHALAPDLVAAEKIGAIGFTGALLVVTGSALTSLLGRRRRPKLACEATDGEFPAPIRPPAESGRTP
ncbi:MAG: DMT family transporter [Lysobacteraceae bacterium]